MVNESLLAPLNSCCTTTLWQDQWQGRASWLLKVNSWISWICIHIGTSETKLDLIQRGTKLMYMNVISCWMYSSFHLRARLVYLASCCSCWWRHLAWVPVVGQIKEESVKVGGDEQHPAKETSLYYLLPMPWTPFSTLLCRLLSWRRKQQNIEQSREGKPRIEVQVQTLIFLGCKRVNQTKPAAGKEELRNIRCLPPLHCADSWSSSSNSLFSSGCKRVNQTKPAAGKEELRNFRYLPPLHCAENWSSSSGRTFVI